MYVLWVVAVGGKKEEGFGGGREVVLHGSFFIIRETNGCVLVVLLSGDQQRQEFRKCDTPMCCHRLSHPFVSSTSSASDWLSRNVVIVSFPLN